MFTGLIEEVGTITRVAASGDGALVTIGSTVVVEDISHGDSIAVSGVCLTVVDLGEHFFVAEVMKETLNHSVAATWGEGTAVNLERATKVGDRLGGHLVQGHVDSTTTVLAVTPGERWSVVRVSLAPESAPLVAHKGSLTLDGVSLTVSAVGREWAEVSLIPETLSATTLGTKQPGDAMNLETDMIARHILRFQEFAAVGGTA
jgi:riboflavin synthase